MLLNSVGAGEETGVRPYVSNPQRLRGEGILKAMLWSCSWPKKKEMFLFANPRGAAEGFVDEMF
jgi:hypothetical protein